MNNQSALQSRTDGRKNDLRKKHEVYTTSKQELQKEFATIPQGCTMNSTQRKMLKQFRKTHDELRGLELLQKKEKEKLKNLIYRGRDQTKRQQIKQKKRMSSLAWRQANLAQV